MSDPYESNYHIAQGENVQGPYTYTQVLELIQQGKAQADMLFSRDGADWLEGYECPELFSLGAEEMDAPEPPVRRGARGGRGGGGRRKEPHRGGAILALGILGLVLSCVIFGIMAWVMASTDLAKMRAGRMDRDGQGLTNAGRILGIVSVVLSFGWIIFFMLFVLGGAAMSVTG